VPATGLFLFLYFVKSATQFFKMRVFTIRVKKYTTDELVALYDKKDWAALWKIATPMVKHAVRRCMQRGLDPYYVRDDLMQEAYLAAWACLPRWNAFEASLQTWVLSSVRIALTDANRRVAGGMIGGRDSTIAVVSMHAEVPDADDVWCNDEQELADGIEATLTYKEAPEGFGDPAEEVDRERLLLQLPEKDRDMVRRLCGVGVPAETQSEYSAAEGLSRPAVAKRLERLRGKLDVTISRKPAKQVI